MVLDRVKTAKRDRIMNATEELDAWANTLRSSRLFGPFCMFFFTFHGVNPRCRIYDVDLLNFSPFSATGNGAMRENHA
jgi:hypothetical protein